MNDARIKTIRDRYRKNIGQAFLRPNGPLSPVPRAQLQIGERLRDHSLWQFPILPGAIQAYIDLAATREWTVSGSPRSVARTVEWINNAESINTYTGLVDYGYDAYLRRKALDYLSIGMMTMGLSEDLDATMPALEYIDPVRLSFQRERDVLQNGFVQPVKPEEKVWTYNGSRRIKAKNLIHHYPNPLGANGFIAPIMYLLPTATLAWLIRESDTAAIDGRKIRDILLVADPKVHDAIEDGILTSLALWQGNPEEDVGFPVITLNGLGNNKVSDLYAWLNISRIPETLNREEFTFAYVNEIAAALGLALRHFWNNERTTNRALEIVQEQRQQQKGPSTFVRTEQRLMNRSGFLNLKQFGGARTAPRFAFIEETDMSSMKDRATALKDIATAAGMIQDKLGMYIKPESMVAWLQMEDMLPNEIELIDIELAAQRTESDAVAPKEGEVIGQSDPDTTSQPTQEQPMDGESLEKSLDYGEVVMAGSGRIVAQRHKIFSIAKYLEPEVKEVAKTFEIAIAEEPVYIEQSELEEFVQKAIEDAEDHNVRLVRKLGDSDYLTNWLSLHKTEYDEGLLNCAVHNCLNNIKLTTDEGAIIDRIALDWEEIA